jgi:hypothetical protein
MLLTSRVHKNINSKTLIFGFELFDCFLILATCAILNFVLGASLIAWIVPALVTVILYFGKKDRPEGYLLDLVQFWAASKVLSASYPDFEYRPYVMGRRINA